MTIETKANLISFSCWQIDRLSDFKDFKYNYKFNILKKRVSIFKLINAVNESISKSISHDDKF